MVTVRDGEREDVIHDDSHLSLWNVEKMVKMVKMKKSVEEIHGSFKTTTTPSRNRKKVAHRVFHQA
jgi:hypothetical protein